jgi:copper(I)-binding protein
MEKHFSKRRLIPVAVALLALVCASGVAYAYWTANGSGTGTGTTAAGVTNLTATSAALNPMYPGDSAQPIVITVHNPSTQTVYVTSVSASVSGTSNVGCTAGDFTVVGSPEAVGQEIAASGNLTLTSPLVPPTIQFHDTGVNQDACKGVTVNLSFSIS